jgi:hypothetical protein
MMWSLQAITYFSTYLLFFLILSFLGLYDPSQSDQRHDDNTLSNINSNWKLMKTKLFEIRFNKEL